jgi:hypothetical protein
MHDLRVEITRGQVADHPGHVFVPRGDPALTRALVARGALRVVSMRRGRREQIGVAATAIMMDEAKAEVAASAGRRAVARERSRERRAEAEEDYRAAFERELQGLFPALPEEDRATIVRHTCEVSSGRVGRSSWAKTLAEEPIRLAVRAHVRHAHTDYDARLRRAGIGAPFGRASRDDRKAARRAVQARIDAIVSCWEGAKVAVPEPVTPPPPARVERPVAPSEGGAKRLWQRPLG